MRQALGIFAKEPLPGHVKTRLVPPLTVDEAAGLYRCMLEDVIATAMSLPGVEPYLFYAGGSGAATAFPPFIAGRSCLPQNGRDLGERMDNALRTLLAAGHDRAVLIGSDSPDLPASFIMEAFTRLDSTGTDAVFGPSADGGYYLVAVKRPCPELFGGISWSTPTVLEASLERAGAAGIRVKLLPEWYDVDTFPDVSRILAGETGAPLTREFLLALKPVIGDRTDYFTTSTSYPCPSR